MCRGQWLTKFVRQRSSGVEGSQHAFVLRRAVTGIPSGTPREATGRATQFANPFPVARQGLPCPPDQGTGPTGIQESTHAIENGVGASWGIRLRIRFDAQHRARLQTLARPSPDLHQLRSHLPRCISH